MSEPASKFDELGLERDPFSTTIADEEIAAQYSLVGRDDQEYRLREFVQSGIREPDLMKRRLIFGEYGTGKSHHLIELRDEVREGVEVEEETYEALAVYVGNLGLSIRRLYEKIVEEILEDEPRLQDYVEALPDVEPDSSVDEAYQYERLQDNVATNLRKIVKHAREELGYRSVYLFIDEAEDIEAENDEQKVQRFIRSFLHFVNELNTSGLHILLGFSQGARMAITQYEDDDDSLGNALVQRFQGDDIYLGDLTESDVKEMLIDRMDVHRTSNRGEISPIVEDTIDVVTEVTGGHPRSILQIYSEALNYAAKVDADRIDGDAIVYALRDFTSLVRDEDLLSGEALTTLKKGLEDAHPDARDDFERLEGRLIGEGDAIPENSFSDGVPGALMSPITVEGEDAGEIRVLEKRDRHGRYYYVLSEEAKDFLFRGKGDEGTEIQKLDLQATNAPDKYQRYLSRGLALAVQSMGKGSLHKDPVTIASGRYEYALYLIDVDRGPGKGKPTVAVGVYNGQEIPVELLKLYVEAYQSRGATFGALVKQNQQQSAEANKYVNGLDSEERQFVTDRIIEVNLSTEQRDNFIYGRLLALGDSEIQAEGMVDGHTLISEIGIIGGLQETFTETILPFPDKVHRNVIDHLEKNDAREFTIGDLQDELDIQSYNLKSDHMIGLKDQNLVAKSGQRWIYPDIENDRPPWYEIYRRLNEQGALTMEEIQAQVTTDFALGCSRGDENAMIQWYLDHLQRQNYVEPTTVEREGEIHDAYDIVSVEDQYNEARSRAQSRLDAAQVLYEEAVSLDAKNINSYKNRIEDYTTQLDQFDEVFNPTHNDLNEVRALIDEIVGLEEDLEDTVSDRKEKIIGNAVSVRDDIDDLRRKISKSDVEGSFGSQLDDYNDELGELDTELESLIDNEQYERLAKRTGSIDDRVDTIDDEVEQLLGVKSKCTEKYKQLRDIADSAKDHIDAIAADNSSHAELEEQLETIESRFDDYRDQFNSGEFQVALSTLEEIEPDLKSLKDQAQGIEQQQQQYLKQLDDLDPEISDEEGKDLLEEARKTVKKGDFATAPTLIDDLRERAKGPTRREQFVAALREYDGSFTKIVTETDFNETEAFSQLKDVYSDSTSDIEDITVVMTNE
jgi:uncharacterized coiled-coil DUF342 family protein